MKITAVTIHRANEKGQTFGTGRINHETGETAFTLHLTEGEERAVHWQLENTDIDAKGITWEPAADASTPGVQLCFYINTIDALAVHAVLVALAGSAGMFKPDSTTWEIGFERGGVQRTLDCSFDSKKSWLELWPAGSPKLTVILQHAFEYFRALRRHACCRAGIFAPPGLLAVLASYRNSALSSGAEGQVILVKCEPPQTPNGELEVIAHVVGHLAHVPPSPEPLPERPL